MTQLWYNQTEYFNLNNILSELKPDGKATTPASVPGSQDATKTYRGISDLVAVV